MHIVLLKIILTLSIFGSLVVPAYAQSILASGINVSTDPRSPAPGEDVTVSVQSSSTDLNQAMFSWYVNGVLKKEGLALKSFSFVAGGAGSSQLIEINISTKDLGVVTKRLTINPSGVDIIEQADSFTPPFYKGKALPGPENSVTLIAIPNLISGDGRKLGIKEIIFKWKKKNTVLGSLSGLGVNNLSIKTARLPGDTDLYSVEATSPENGLSAKGSIAISAFAPKIVLYEEDPLRGVLMNRALGKEYALAKNELSAVAYPFSFGKSTLTDIKTSYTWSINSKGTNPTGATNNSITVRKPETTSGSSVLSISIGNSVAVFERAAASLRINFIGTENNAPSF